MMQDQRHGALILSRTMRPRLECGPAYGVLHSNDGLPFVLCLLAINPPLSAFRYLFGVKPLDQRKLFKTPSLRDGVLKSFL